VIRVALADDHKMVRAGLKEILADTGDIEVVAEATNGLEVMARVREIPLDVLVLDMSMPGRSGIELIRQVKGEKPGLRILVLSMHSEEQYAVRALKAGASGYLTKEGAADELVAAIRRIAGGGAYVTPETAQRLALEGDGRRDVDEELEPQDVDGQQRLAEAVERRDQDEPEQRDVGRYEKDESLLDVRHHPPALGQAIHERRERVVAQDQVGRLARDCRTGAHGHGDVGVLEGGRVVDSVAGDRHGAAGAPRRLDEAQLLLRQGAGHEAQLRQLGQ